MENDEATPRCSAEGAYSRDAIGFATTLGGVAEAETDGEAKWRAVL